MSKLEPPWAEIPYFAGDAEPVEPEEEVPSEWRFRPGQTALLTDDHTHHWAVTVVSDQGGWVVTVRVGIPSITMSVPRQRVISDAMRAAVDHLIATVEPVRTGIRQGLAPDEHDRTRQALMAAMIRAIEAHGGVIPEDSWAAANIGWADETLLELERRRPRTAKPGGKARQSEELQADPVTKQMAFEI